MKTENVALAHGDRTIVRGVSISVEAGVITVLRGANGSGKTTLLRTLAGLREPAAGAISIGDVDRAAAAERRRHGVFFGHENALKAALTIEENLKCWTALYGTGRERQKEALEALNVADLSGRRAETLSAGQKRRAGLCRVLLSGKPLWFLDEPTASMDAAAIGRFGEIITRHRENGGAALIATHDPLPFEGVRTLELAAA